ncbi:MAG: amidase [Acetobacteraceae bacterium]|nr:amidase [Pseudomonadota bacterium]
MSNPLNLTATQAVRRIQDGTLRAEDLMEAYIERIDARESEVQAFAWFSSDQARFGARAAKEGPLQGLPIGVKDVLDTEDMPSEYGSPIWEGWQPRADAACVAWARECGAVVMGKTVTTEFATRKPGPTANPANINHTPGGSSSGSAAGVAAGFFPLAFGTQTAGSIIRPAAFCGVVGYKPSYGMISRIGMKIMSDSLDTVGMLATNVADCALFASALSGRELGDPDEAPDRAPRIGICRGPTWYAASEETHALLDRAAEAVARAGAQVTTLDLPEIYNRLVDAHPIVMNTESARALGWELTIHPDLISDDLRARMDFGLEQSPVDLDGAYAVFDATQRALPEVMGDLDVLLTPSAPGEAPEGLGWTGDPCFNFIWTSLRVPCVTVPAGTGPKGLPLGIQIVGRRGDDRPTLAWARWVQAALG